MDVDDFLQSIISSRENRLGTDSGTAASSPSIDKVLVEIDKLYEKDGQGLKQIKQKNNETARERQKLQDLHEIVIFNGPMRPLELSPQARILLRNLPSEIDKSFQRRYSGELSDDAWQVTYGNTKIFEKPPKRRGDIFLLLDMSHSMQCSCPECLEGCSCPECLEDGAGALTNRSYIATQIIGILSQRFSKIQIYGFCSSLDENYIVPIPAGKVPTCQRRGEYLNRGGNADCTALMWLKDVQLGGLNDSTTVIIISDGAPYGPFPIRCDSVEHTRRLAQEIYNNGVRYVSILLGDCPFHIYPANITAHIDTLDQITKLQDVIDYVEARSEGLDYVLTT